jgi:hemolysin activation/secretion protein
LYQTATVESKSLYNTSNATIISKNKINDISVGLNGDESDSWLGGGLSSFSVTYTAGNVDLSDAPVNQANDATTAQTAGHYDKWLLQGLREQQLVGNWVLYGSFTDQIASKNLDSSESLVMGGPGAVRAYPAGEAPADEGLIVTAELRYNTTAPYGLGSLQYQMFYDHGSVRLHHAPWASFQSSGLNNEYGLSGKGLGVNLYKENAYMLSASVANKNGANPNGKDADGLISSTRFWIQLAKYF